MATPSKSMTTSEFAKATGIPAATISKLIREGKLKARKEGQSWMIPQSQLAAKVVRELGKPPKPPKAKKSSTPAAARTPARAAKPVRSAPTPSPRRRRQRPLLHRPNQRSESGPRGRRPRRRTPRPSLQP